MIGINQSPDPIIRPACQFPNTSIASWNMRGSMFPKVQGEKNINRQKTVKRLCQNNDIVMLQECYVTGHFDQENRRYTGQINLIKEMLPDHIILMNYVWENNGEFTTCIIIKKEYLQKNGFHFTHLRHDGIFSSGVELRNPLSRIAIINVYFPTGITPEKIELRKQHINSTRNLIPNGFREDEKSTLIMGGDYNVIRGPGERIQRFNRDGYYRNSPDGYYEAEEEVRQTINELTEEMNLGEISHGNYTCCSAGTRQGPGRNGIVSTYKTLSRLDRFFTDNSIIMGMTYDWRITMDIIKDNPSDHSPINLKITNKQRKTNGGEKEPKLQEWVYRHEQFPTLVKKFFSEIGHQTNPWNDLDNLENAIFRAQTFIKRNHKRNVASTHEEKIAITHATIFGMQSGQMSIHRAMSMIDQFPALGAHLRIKLLGHGNKEIWFDRTGIETTLRDLIREKNDEDIEEIRNGGDFEQDREIRKTGIMDRLSLLRPGTKTRIETVWDPARERFVTDSEEIAEAIHPKFQGMFESSNKSQENISNFINEFPNTIPEGINWDISIFDIWKVIDQKNKSHPGPGGIPFEAYQYLKTLTTDVIKRIIDDMTGKNGDPNTIPEKWTKCLLFLVPKSADLVTEEGLPAFSPGKVRPVMVSPSIIRIISKCFLEHLMPITQQFVSAEQKGFVRGRNIMDNIYELQEFFWKNHKENETSYILLVDFSNAFSSIDWGYMIRILTKIGIQENWAKGILAFLRTRVDLKFQGITKENYVQIGAGCRQGDPLSGLLFAIFLEPLLWKLRQLEGLTPRGFADDIGIGITRASQAKFRSICTIFNEFEDASNLKVNKGKTFWISCRRRINHRKFKNDKKHFKCNLWPGFENQYSAMEIYLGVPFGIDVTRTTAHQKALDKLIKTQDEWEKVPLNHANRAFVANVFLGTFFGYISQIYPMSKGVADEIDGRLKRFFSKMRFIDKETFYSIPAVFGIKHGHFIRDSYLWSAAAFLRSSRHLREQDFKLHNKSKCIKHMLTTFRGMYQEAAGVEFPDPPQQGVPGTRQWQAVCKQSEIYKKLYDHKYKNQQHIDMVTDAIRKSHPYIDQGRAVNIIEDIKNLYQQKGRELTEAEIRQGKRPPQSFKVHNFHIFNILKLLWNGIPTKTRMCWRNWEDRRCRFCNHETDSIQHWLGREGVARCSGITNARAECNLTYKYQDINSYRLDAYHLFFWSSVIYTHRELQQEGISNADPEGIAISMWFRGFTNPSERKRNKKHKSSENINSLGKPWCLVERDGKPSTYIAVSKISPNEVELRNCSRRLPISSISIFPNEIHIVIVGKTTKHDGEFSGSYGAIGLGIQNFPIAWSGEGLIGNSGNPDGALIVGIRKLLNEITSWNSIYSRVRDTEKIKILTDSRSMASCVGGRPGGLPKDYELGKAMQEAAVRRDEINHTLESCKITLVHCTEAKTIKLAREVNNQAIEHPRRRDSVSWVSFNNQAQTTLTNLGYT